VRPIAKDWLSSFHSLNRYHFDAAIYQWSLGWHFVLIAAFLFEINSIYLNNLLEVNYNG
jgi:hypothetical protein